MRPNWSRSSDPIKTCPRPTSTRRRRSWRGSWTPTRCTCAQNMPGVVTGKPLEIGGSRGRVEATGRGVTICALDEMAEMGLRARSGDDRDSRLRQRRMYAAKLFEERGCKVVGISDVTGAYYNRRGHLCHRRDGSRARSIGTLEGFKGGEKITNAELLSSRLRRARAGGAGEGLYRRRPRRKYRRS